MKFSVQHLADAEFAERGLRKYYEYRDLGIKESMYFKDPDGIQIELLSDPLMYFDGQQLDE